MKRAILSDIHGNLEALEAVLADIDKQNVDQIFCLGDVIGYGPNPRECLDIVMGFDLCILGNHDQGALFDPEGFSSGAENAIFWTRQHLENLCETDEEKAAALKRLQFLGNLPRTHFEGDQLFVHGSARSPLNEYVFPEDVYNARKIERIFSLIEGSCFQGHTHVPGVFTDDCRFQSPQELNNLYTLGKKKAMVNVGSVGQPRDGNPLSCYLIVDDGRLEYRRVDYPREKTIEKIHAIAQLDRYLGDRLKEGR
ncbi:MAG: metallophosphatase family protein [bacterium]|nr:metallophosphatase family protein [bacterium]